MKVIQLCFQHFFLYHVDQAWANRRSPTVRQSIANIFNFKKIIEVEGCFIFMVGVNFIIGTQIGANFTGGSCKLCFNTIIGKIFSKKNTQPQKSNKINKTDFL